MASLIDRLPLDVWHVVLQYACTDGGRTGAALAHTSSGLRTASAEYRFYSLKLTSLAQIGRILLCLDRIERLRARAAHSRGDTLDYDLNARNLLLSFFPEDCESLVRPWCGWNEYSSRKGKGKWRSQLAEDGCAWLAAKGAWDRQFIYLVPRLFSLVAPTLESLTVLQHLDIPLPHIRAEFPVLRELALLADDGIFVQPPPQRRASRDVEVDRTSGGEPDGDLGDRARFPSLTHLHIVYEGPKRHSWERTLPIWTTLAPSLTHLRASQAYGLIPEVVEDTPTTSFRHTEPSRSLRTVLALPRIQRIVIQPWVLQPVGGHESLEERRRLSTTPVRQSNTEVVVMRGRWFRHGYWRDRLRWEWEDRMLGEAGCWAEREEDEGEWAFERRKRAETAVRREIAKVVGRTHAEQVREVIRLNTPDRIFRPFGSRLIRWGLSRKRHKRATSV